MNTFSSKRDASTKTHDHHPTHNHEDCSSSINAEKESNHPLIFDDDAVNVSPALECIETNGNDVAFLPNDQRMINNELSSNQQPAPSTPNAASVSNENSENLPNLPTPCSTSDGRSEAASLLRARIQKMQLSQLDSPTNSVGGSSSVGGSNSLASNGHIKSMQSEKYSQSGQSDESGKVGRNADFSNNDKMADPLTDHPESDETQQIKILQNQLQTLHQQKSEAEAESALLSAELVALRGRHEEERRTLQRTVEELRRRNEDLESRLSALSLQSSGGGGGGAVGPGGRKGSGLGMGFRGGAPPTNPNMRSVSCPRTRADEDPNNMDPDANNNAAAGPFGFRMRAFAQRWSSPPPRARGGPTRFASIEDTDEKDEKSDEKADSPMVDGDRSCSSTINTNEDFGQIEFPTPRTEDMTDGSLNLPSSSYYSEASQIQEEQQKLISSLKSQLTQSEHKTKVLSQRLKIVKESGDAVIRSLNEELADVAEDRARSESAMIQELATLDSERRKEREEYERRIKEWIVRDEDRRLEVEEYQRRIESLLGTVRIMDNMQSGDEEEEKEVQGSGNLESASSASWDKEGEREMKSDLIAYIELLKGGGKEKQKMRKSPLVSSINEAFDLEFNANPNVADEMIDYYRTRPELKEFTLKSELPRMDYEILTKDEETGQDRKLASTEEIRSYFNSLEEGSIDEEMELLIRASNQSLLADPLAMLTSDKEGSLVHSGSFHSTVIATVCSFKLDLRRKGQRRVKVRCILSVCVPSGSDGNSTNEHTLASSSSSIGEASDKCEKLEKKSATLELATADLAIEFSPSPTSTPSGPLVKYELLDIVPSITDYSEGSENSHAIQLAAVVLTRDRHSHIRYVSESKSTGPDVVDEVRPDVKSRFMSRMRAFSSNLKESSSLME